MLQKFPALAAYRKSRWYKRSLWAGAIFLVYVLFGFFALPAIIKSQLLKRLPPITKRQLAIRQVRFNPLALSLTIRGLSLTEPDGEVFASWEELYVNFQLSSLFRFGWTFDEVKLKQPFGHLIWFKDGQFNFSNMGGDAPPPPKPSKPAKAGRLPAINVARLHIDDGLVVWDDRTHSLPLKVELKPINFSLTNLTTRMGKGSFYNFEAQSDSGKRLAWSGELVAQPFRSRGHLDLEGFEGARWTAYVRDYLRAVVTKGRISVAADYAMELGTNGFGLVVSNGAVQLTQFEVKDPTNNEVITTLPLLQVGRLDFNLQGHSLHAGLIKLDGYTKSIRIEKDGTLNLNLLVEQKTVVSTATNLAAAAAPPPSAPSAPWVFGVDDFQFTDATITFADFSRTSPFETTLSPMEVRVQHFTTKPESNATFEFKLPSEAGEVVSGKGTMCVVPLRLGGTVKLGAIEIKKYSPYYEEFMHGEVVSGKLDSSVDFQLLSTARATDLTMTNAGVALLNLQLKAADGGETIVTIPTFGVGQTEFDLRKQMVTVGSVASSNGTILVRQKKDGLINLAELFKAPATGAHEARKVDSTGATNTTDEIRTEKSPWTVLVKEVTFDQYAIKLDDQKPAKEANLGIDQFKFIVKNISTRSNEAIDVALEARLNEAGRVRVDGTAKISPPEADLDLTVSDLDLRPFQPYLNEAVRIGLNNGQFNTRSHLRYGGEEAGPKMRFTGDLSLTNLLTTDQVLFKEFVRWDLLSVSGLDFALEPDQLQVREINWRRFNTSVVIGPDHRPNLQTILPAKATNTPVAPAAEPATANAGLSAPPAKAAEFPIQVGTLTLENSAFHFADESIEPRCAFDIVDFGGSIQGLSSEPQAVATVNLRGKVDTASPFSISGKVNPLARDLALDLTVGFTNTDLTAFSTYLEKYAGHPLNKGKLNMGLHYDIHQKQLKAENTFMLDHFTLGPRNDSTNATHLPVKLAVALLKDTSGRINLDLPVTGRTDDPQFRVAPILLKALVNLMLKAATSPFSLLGSLVGGGEELSFVEFAAGKADISEVEGQKLVKLAQALEQRPALSVEIAGSFDPHNDRPALARLKLEQEIKTLRLRELAESGKTVSSLELVPLEPAQRERLLKVVLAEMGTNQTLVLQPVGVADTNAVEAMTNTFELRPPSAQSTNVPAARRWQDGSAAQAKGASLLIPGIELTGLGVVKSVPVPESPKGTNSTPATAEDIESRLIAAIEVSQHEQRELMKRRATAVQTEILKGGKIAADRLFIVTPKAGGPVGKGEARATLSLE